MILHPNVYMACHWLEQQMSTPYWCILHWKEKTEGIQLLPSQHKVDFKRCARKLDIQGFNYYCAFHNNYNLITWI